jgi:hypothetical protein
MAMRRGVFCARHALERPSVAEITIFPRPPAGAGGPILRNNQLCSKERRPVEQTVRLQRETGPDCRGRLRLFIPVMWVMVYRLAIPFDKVLTHRGFVITNQGRQILGKKRICGMETGDPEVVFGESLNVATCSAAIGN